MLAVCVWTETQEIGFQCVENKKAISTRKREIEESDQYTLIAVFKY